MYREGQVPRDLEHYFIRARRMRSEYIVHLSYYALIALQRFIRRARRVLASALRRAARMVEPRRQHSPM